MPTFVQKLRKDEHGATATEYALLVVAIALIMVVGAFILGNTLRQNFSDTADCVADAGTGPSCD